jgi:excisionase family DNA binding protein
VTVRPRNVDDLRTLGAWATVEEVAAFFGCSRSQLYADIDAGRVPFPVVRIGRKRRIPTAPVLDLFGVDPSAGNGNHPPNSAEGAGPIAPSTRPSRKDEDDGKPDSTTGP